VYGCCCDGIGAETCGVDLDSDKVSTRRDSNPTLPQIYLHLVAVKVVAPEALEIHVHLLVNGAVPDVGDVGGKGASGESRSILWLQYINSPLVADSLRAQATQVEVGSSTAEIVKGILPVG